MLRRWPRSFRSLHASSSAVAFLLATRLNTPPPHSRSNSRKASPRKNVDGGLHGNASTTGSNQA
eukprot:15456235-Alexandrium_andersonii.AAC.1